MALTQIDDRGLKTPIDLLDNEKIRFGTGNDLEVFHDGSNSYIKEAGTGQLLIQADNLILENAAGANYLVGMSGAEVILYHNDQQKFQTTADGVTVNGDLNLQQPSSTTNYIQWDNSEGKLKLKDDIKITVGDGEDLQIYHNGTNSFVKNTTGQLCLNSNEFGVANENFTENIIRGTADGDVKLFYDGVEKLATTSTGVQLSDYLYLNDGKEIRFGDDGDLKIYHDGSNSYLDNDTGGVRLNTASGDIQINKGTSEYMGRFITDGAVELYYDGTKQFETASSGLLGADNHRLMLGSDSDLQLWHDGTNSIIDATHGSGTFYIRGDALALQTSQSTPETYLLANSNGAVELYYDNSKKLETKSWGVEVTGAINVGTSYFKVKDNGHFYAGDDEDLKIYHDGSHSFIKDTGTGNFYITGSYLAFMNAAGSEYMLDGLENGAASLFYDGVNKFQTNANGVTVFGSEGIKLYTENGNNTDTNSIVWRGGSDSQQANVAQLVAKQVSDWGGELQLKVKKNDGSLNDNYATVLHAKGDSNGHINLCQDSVTRFQVNGTGFKAGAAIPGDHATGGLIINSSGESSLYRSSNGIVFIMGGPQSGQKIIEFRHTSTGIGNISKDGTTGINFNTTNSDRTLKKNFEDWTDSYWTGFKDLKPQKFNFLFQEDSDPKIKGYIAQDLASTFPEAYPKDVETDKYMFNPSGMVPYLMKTLQEAIVEIETLKTKVAALESS